MTLRLAACWCALVLGACTLVPEGKRSSVRVTRIQIDSPDVYPSAVCEARQVTGSRIPVRRCYWQDDPARMQTWNQLSVPRAGPTAWR